MIKYSTKNEFIDSRSYALGIGEPGNSKGFLKFGKVVGWGQTYTDADDVSAFNFLI